MDSQIASAIRKNQEAALRIRERVVEDAKAEKEWRKRQLTQLRKHNLCLVKEIRQRISLAYEGIVALCSIGVSAELQASISSDHPYVVWGGSVRSCAGGDMADVVWTYRAHIELMKDGVRLHADSLTNGKTDFGGFSMVIPYDHDPFIIRQALKKLATPSRPDNLFFDVLKEDLAAVLTEAHVFEELVLYADMSYLAARFDRGPSPLLLIVDDELEDWRESTKDE